MLLVLQYLLAYFSFLMSYIGKSSVIIIIIVLRKQMGTEVEFINQSINQPRSLFLQGIIVFSISAHKKALQVNNDVLWI